ncbi:hypothetical protein N8D56_11795 [Devosia sp. A8/3-2]|nr:hypothetical protein N8D56_11795 [Devosia sp. A8/3-2]
MTNRRNLLAGAAVLPFIAAPAFAQSPVSGDIQQAMADHLAVELGDQTAADGLAEILFKDALTRSAPTVAPAAIKTIVAFAFGNRPNTESGNTPTDGTAQLALPDPGPINALLADKVAEISAVQPEAKIYAQWEIARYLVDKHKLTQTVSIEPVINADGTITYLSTVGVAEAIIADAGSAEALGQIAVVGHRDHSKRCVRNGPRRRHGCLSARRDRHAGRLRYRVRPVLDARAPALSRARPLRASPVRARP